MYKSSRLLPRRFFFETFKMTFSKIPFGDVKKFNVVIEVPAGSKKKYAFDSEIGAIKLEHISHDLAYPYNYGHIPKTYSGDNDLLDVFVISDHIFPIGTVVQCRAIGVLEVADRRKRDNKILAIPVVEADKSHIKDIADVPDEEIKKIRDFFQALPKARGIDIKLLGIHGAAQAEKELHAAHEFEK